jgi:hypothetical protein
VYEVLHVASCCFYWISDGKRAQFSIQLAQNAV